MEEEEEEQCFNYDKARLMVDTDEDSAEKVNDNSNLQKTTFLQHSNMPAMPMTVIMMIAMLIK